MSTSSQISLEQAIRDSGEGWVLDLFHPPEEAINYIRGTLASVQLEAQTRFGHDAPDLSEDALVTEFRRNPLRMRGFFQALGGRRSHAMLLMVWRIIQGSEIKDIRLTYQRAQRFHAQVILESPDGGEDAPYISESIRDFALLRHIGILESGGRPIFDGFYALNVRER